MLELHEAILNVIDTELYRQFHCKRHGSVDIHALGKQIPPGVSCEQHGSCPSDW